MATEGEEVGGSAALLSCGPSGSLSGAELACLTLTACGWWSLPG